MTEELENAQKTILKLQKMTPSAAHLNPPLQQRLPIQAVQRGINVMANDGARNFPLSMESASVAVDVNSNTSEGQQKELNEVDDTPIVPQYK